MFKVLSFLLFCLIATETNAYLVTNYKASGINYSLPTRLLIAGDGHDLGTLFQEVAKSKALKYREINPDYQIVLITAVEEGMDNKTTLKRWGFNLEAERRQKFNGESFLEEVIRFKKIASIDIFSHSSAQYGIHLDGKANRLTLNTKDVESLNGHFIKDAYAFLHGCNTGFNLAPFLSKSWGIPVAGSMTSTNFQKLHNDGQFYLTENGFFPNADWSLVNDKSFKTPVDCNDGACLRLKPDNQPYVGFWGEYSGGGLPFYKFFCIKNATEDCLRVMAKSMLSYLGTNVLTAASSFEDYKKTVLDFVCPISAKRDLRRECEESLESSLTSGDETYNPFARPLVQCDFMSCQAEIKCKKIPFTGIFKPGTCELINHFNGKATTLVREYKAYLSGFKSINN